MARRKRQSAPLPLTEFCELHSNSIDDEVVTIKKESPTTKTTTATSSNPLTDSNNSHQPSETICPSCSEEALIAFKEERWYHRLLSYMPKLPFQQHQQQTDDEDKNEDSEKFIVRHRMAIIQFGAFATLVGAILIGRKLLKIPHRQ